MNTYTRQDIATAAEHAANRIAPTTNTYKTYWTIQRKPGTRTGQQPTYRVSLNGFWLSTDHINAELLLDVMATGATIRDMREAINDAEARRHRARMKPEPLPLDADTLRPVFNPHKPTQRVTSTHAEPLTLALQFTGTDQEIHRTRQRLAGQLELMEEPMNTTYTRRDLEKKCVEASAILGKHVEIVQEPQSKRYAVTYDLPERLRNNLDEWLRERDCNTIRYWIEHLDAEISRAQA